MTRTEAVTQYNLYIRKRNEYAEKINENNRVKALLEEELWNCNTSMQKLYDVSEKAEIFEILYEKDEAYFNGVEISGIINQLDGLSVHLQNVYDSVQQQVYYWYQKIQEFDAG